MAKKKLPDINLFEKHRNKIAFAGPDECWLWTAGKAPGGYGSLGWRGKTQRAHRVAYETTHGIGIAEGLVVRHKCDTPACVNPAHLELGTHADNVRDKMERGRHRCGMLKGEAHGRARLTDTDIQSIRELYASGGYTMRTLGPKFGVTYQMISLVIRRERRTE